MEKIERILVVGSYAEALVIESRLEQEHIPYVLQRFNDPAFGSFWRRQEGWGLLLAPAEYRSRIEEISGDIRAAGRGLEGGQAN